MSGEAMVYTCPICGERLEDVFWDGETWLLTTEDDMIPCYLDQNGTLAAIAMSEQPYVPVQVVNIHSHYFRKSSFLLWLAIIAAAGGILDVVLWYRRGFQ